MNIKHVILLLLLLLVMQSCSKTDTTIYGKWKLNVEKSTDLASWRYRQLELEIVKLKEHITIVHNWTHSRYGNFIDSVTFTPDVDTARVMVKSPVWQENWFMGVLAKENSIKATWGNWNDEERRLTTWTTEVVQVSQGEATITTKKEYRLNRKGDLLTVQEKRSSRPSVVTLVFDRVYEET